MYYLHYLHVPKVRRKMPAQCYWMLVLRFGIRTNIWAMKHIFTLNTFPLVYDYSSFAISHRKTNNCENQRIVKMEDK